MGLLDTFLAILGLGYIGAKSISDKFERAVVSQQNQVYTDSSALANKLTPADYIADKCRKTLDRPDEMFLLLHKELNYIFGTGYKAKFDFTNPEHCEAAVQLLLSQNNRGNKAILTKDNYTQQIGLPIKWTENNDIANRRKKQFWCDVYQCVEWNLQEKYPDIQFVWKSEQHYSARTKEYNYQWNSRVLIPICCPDKKYYRFW